MLQTGEVIVTLTPLTDDEHPQTRARRDLAVALQNYWNVFFAGRIVFQTWDDLTSAEKKQAVQWAYEAEYAAFLRPTRKD